MNSRMIEIAFLSSLFFFVSVQSSAKEPPVLGITSKDSPQYTENEIVVKFRDTAAEKTEYHLSGSSDNRKPILSASLEQLNHKYKIDKIKPLAPDFRKNRQSLERLVKKGKNKLSPIEKHILRRSKRAPEGTIIPNLGNIFKLQFAKDINIPIQQILDDYRNDPDVEYAELNYIYIAFKTPNDPYYSVQWALNNTGQSYPVFGGKTESGTSGADINAPEAWDIDTGNSNVIVAVIDSGVDYTHRDLTENMWTDLNGSFGYDFDNDDNDPLDDFGHGTHCAGIIAADGNNSQDISGICWNAKIMAVKFLDGGGSGTGTDAVSSIYYAVNNGADVLSNSWGGDTFSESLQDAINYAYSQGVIIVAAAGNNNSDSPTYPAYYDNVISVAATDSNDQKASFSTYGEWVDIAAPGVHILSLRGKNTDMYLGTGYIPGDACVPFGDPNPTMYIASGTSMACPQVAGACALILSINPILTVDEVNLILAETADPIADGICRDGRLELYRAVRKACLSTSRGYIAFDKTYYNCDDNVNILLIDSDLSNSGYFPLSVSSNAGDYETVYLSEINYPRGAFTGTIHTRSGSPERGNGYLEVTDGGIITTSYHDFNDGNGPADIVINSSLDCTPPVISNLQAEILTNKLTVTFDTDKPTIGKISCGTLCGEPYDFEKQTTNLQTSHTIEVTPLSEYTTYYFLITATDHVGNQAVDSNSGNCFSFTTGGPVDINVPEQYPTIQEAIDNAWEGVTISVADGNYTGSGNRDIEFRGKAITLKSCNGPENCIIDCQGSQSDPHRGFLFRQNEDVNSILDGFTITNGYCGGGGIYCYNSSPTIKDCIIKNNRAYDSYGAICFDGSNSIMRNCKIIDNNAAHFGYGGGVCINNKSNVLIADCVFNGNYAKRGSGIDCDSGTFIADRCIFTNNHCTDGATIWVREGGMINNCLITENSGAPAGICAAMVKVSNCTIIKNSRVEIGGAINTDPGSHVINCICRENHISGLTGGQREIYIAFVGYITYNNIQDNNDPNNPYYVSGEGNIDADPCFVQGPLGEYYLSQTATGQPADSPCVDSGSNNSSFLGMRHYTTRTDSISDMGKVDMGYHYPIGINADLNGDGFVDFYDYAIIANDWLQQPQDIGDQNSGDISRDDFIDIKDFQWMAVEWLKCLASSATDPIPIDQATVMNSPLSLKWMPGDKYFSHDIYFGTDFNEVRTADIYDSNVYMGYQDSNAWDTNEYDINGLKFATRYYWRIDERYGHGIIKGDVWSFTTVAEDINKYFIAWWKFDEGTGTIAHDSIGDNDGNIIGGATWTAGKINGALDFDGIDDYINCGNEIPTYLSTEYTVSVWIKKDVINVMLSNKITSCWGLPPETPCLFRLSQYAGGFSFLISDENNTFASATYSINLTTGTWYHVAGVRDGNTLDIYVNGIKGTTGTADLGTTSGYYIGIGTELFSQGPSSTSFFDGIIDDVRIYNKALTEDLIMQIYQDGL